MASVTAHSTSRPDSTERTDTREKNSMVTGVTQAVAASDTAVQEIRYPTGFLSSRCFGGLGNVAINAGAKSRMPSVALKDSSNDGDSSENGLRAASTSRAAKSDVRESLSRCRKKAAAAMSDMTAARMIDGDIPVKPAYRMTSGTAAALPQRLPRRAQANPTSSDRCIPDTAAMCDRPLTLSAERSSRLMLPVSPQIRALSSAPSSPPSRLSMRCPTTSDHCANRARQDGGEDVSTVSGPV